MIAGVAPSYAEELKFTVTPGLGEAEMRVALEPFLTYLSGALGPTVSLYVAKDDGDLRVQMEAGPLQPGFLDRAQLIGAYSDYGINTVFLENNWNDAAPQPQERYFGNFVMSTRRIGCYDGRDVAGMRIWVSVASRCPVEYS